MATDAKYSLPTTPAALTSIRRNLSPGNRSRKGLREGKSEGGGGGRLE
jgi:hypothetical protein